MYHKGIPHKTKYHPNYHNICPDWISKEEVTFLEQFEAGTLEDDFMKTLEDDTFDLSQYFMSFDSSCQPAVQWCESHVEVQGKVSLSLMV